MAADAGGESARRNKKTSMGGVANLQGVNPVSHDRKEIVCTLHAQLAAVGAGSEREHTGATAQQATG